MKKYYVYMLIDPRIDLPFYVGKGSGHRAHDHLRETEENTDNKFKYYKIRKIRSEGLEPTIEYAAINLEEDTAYDYEEELIAAFGRYGIDEGGILTNICEGNRPPRVDPKIVSETMKKYYINNPDIIAKMSERMKRVHSNDPSLAKRHSEIMKGYIAENANYMDYLVEASKEYWGDDENRLKMAETTRQYFNDHPEARDATSERMKEYWSKEENIRKHSEIMKTIHANDPTIASNHSIVMTKRYEDNPELCIEQSIRAKQWHKENPDALRGENNHSYGKKHSEERKQHLRDWHKEHPDALRGENNPRFGIKMSDEEKAKRSARAKELGLRPPPPSGPQPESQRKAIGDALRGKPKSAEARANGSAVRKGKKIKWSKEAIEKSTKTRLENQWKYRIMWALNKEFRDHILPLVYGQIIIHELVRDKFKTYKIVDLEKEAFRPEKGRVDRLVICLKGNLVFKFIIG